MENSTKFEKVIAVIQRVKSCENIKIERSTYLGKDLEFDSIAIVDLWFELRKEFKMQLNVNDFFTTIRTKNANDRKNDFSVQLLLDYLEGQIGKA